MYILKRKRSSRKLTVEPQARTERRKGIKVKLYLLYNKGKGDHRPRLHPARLPACGRQRPLVFSATRKEQERKGTANVIQRGQGPSQEGS